jgi:hypothetical protein
VRFIDCDNYPFTTNSSGVNTSRFKASARLK